MTDYDIKNKLLANYAKEVSAMDFYRDMFPVDSFERKGELSGKANGILCSIKDGKGRHEIIFDEHQEIEDHLQDDFVIVSPVSYFGKRRNAYNASLLYGVCFDLDAVGEKELLWILERLENPHYPRATYIANSGNGLHLYYLLREPVPLYKSKHKQLSALKHELTRLIWNKYTSRIPTENRQYQGVFQGFRMVGTKSKNGQGIIRAFKTGEKVDLSFFNAFVSDEYQIVSMEYSSSLTLSEAKEKYPDWYERRIEKGEGKGRWHIKRDLYDWWLHRISTDADLRVGHRYFALACLASYAVKCDISEDELREDSYALKERMNILQDDFSDDDIESALNFYQESFVTFPRDEIAKISGLKISKNKRNGRKRAEHIKLMNFVRDEINGNKSWYENSPHSGRKSKKDTVQQWRQQHPEGKKIDCSRDTGLHINTVYKWWV